MLILYYVSCKHDLHGGHFPVNIFWLSPSQRPRQLSNKSLIGKCGLLRIMIYLNLNRNIRRPEKSSQEDLRSENFLPFFKFYLPSEGVTS